MINDKLSFVSDIYGGLSENKCKGSFGHDTDYWKDPKALTREAFANFFSAYARRDNDEIDYLQQAFPTATNVFINILTKALK